MLLCSVILLIGQYDFETPSSFYQCSNGTLYSFFCKSAYAFLTKGFLNVSLYKIFWTILTHRQEDETE